jgi:hypothetical protein
MDESSLSQNRRSRRSNVLLAATVETSRGDVRVRLRNLSSDGALIEGDELPPKGEEILFRRNDISVPGRIAWIHDGHAGISFDRQLDPDVVLRNVPAAKPKVQLKFRRPGVTATELSPQEMLYIKRWL